MQASPHLPRLPSFRQRPARMQKPRTGYCRRDLGPSRKYGRGMNGSPVYRRTRNVPPDVLPISRLFPAQTPMTSLPSEAAGAVVTAWRNGPTVIATRRRRKPYLRSNATSTDPLNTVTPPPYPQPHSSPRPPPFG